VTEFLQRLGLEILAVLKFFLSLFDWAEILATHRVLKDVFNASVDTTRAAVTSHAIGDALRDLAGDVRDAIGAPSSVPAAPADVVGPPALGLAQPSELAVSMTGAASGVHARLLSQRLWAALPTTDDGTGEPAVLTPAPNAHTSAPARPAAGPGAPDLSSLLELPGLLPSPASMSVYDVLDAVRAAAAATFEGAFDGLADLVDLLQDGLAGAIDAVMAALTATIDVPIVSDIYTWLTGEDLTLLDAFCLALAVPVNVAYGVATAIAGAQRSFSADASGLAGLLAAAPATTPRDERSDALALGAAGGPPDDAPAAGTLPAECAYVILQATRAVIGFAADIGKFGTALGRQNVPGGQPANGFVLVERFAGFGTARAAAAANGMFFILSVASDVIDAKVTAPQLQRRIAAADPSGTTAHLFGLDPNTRLVEAMCFQAAVHLAKAGLEANRVVAALPAGAAAGDPSLGMAVLDWTFAAGAFGYFVARAVKLTESLDTLNRSAVSDDLRHQFERLQVQRMLELWVTVLGFGFNDWTVQAIERLLGTATLPFYIGLSGTRGALRGAAAALHASVAM
jgi:hypothetical protein